MTGARIGAADVAAALAGQMERLAPELLPTGRRDGPHWRCGGVDGSPGQSLAIHLRGDKAGVWHDFATGEAGDALDLVAATRFRGDLKGALEWAREWLGIGDGRPLPPPVRRAPERAAATEAAEQAERRRKALALFLSGKEGIGSTPVADYLTGRGIILAELGRVPRALRWHPEVWCREAGGSLPAMLAAITDCAGQHVATHRTWLARDDAGAWRKAPLRDPKMTLGSYAGGFIPLWRGVSGKPLRDAPPGEAVAIAEGIETALSVALACPEFRVLASVALPNMARLVLPATVARVVLCRDNDDHNPKAGELLMRAAERFAAEGREVRIACPPVGKDFNDTLRAETTA